MVTIAKPSPLENHQGNTPDEILIQRMKNMASGDHLPNKVVEIPTDALRNFPHSKRVGNYLLGRTIGEGSFAKVKEGLHTLTGEKVAVKVIDKKKAKEDSYVRKNLRREGKLLQAVRHVNVAQLYEIMETENSYYLVLELCEGGDLMEHICHRKRLEENEVRKYMRQIVSAVEYLHRAGILHRDLKVENLLLSDTKDVKIIDFGLSNSVKVTATNEGYKCEEFLVTQCGSPAYAAPELLANKKYGPQVDVWSIGVNMYAMLTGNLPFTVHPFNIKSLQNKMMNGEMNALPESITRNCKDFVRRLLTPDPEKRITLSDAMQHTWLTEGRNRPLEPAIFPNRLKADELDQDIVKHITQNMDFKVSEIIRMVVSNIPHATTASYHLFKKKLVRYNAALSVSTKVNASDARHLVSSLPEGKARTTSIAAKHGHDHSPNKVVHPTPITVGAMMEIHGRGKQTRRPDFMIDDSKDSDSEYLEIQLSRRQPGTRRRIVRRQVKNDRILTRILNVRNNGPVPSTSHSLEGGLKNHGVTVDAFQIEKPKPRNEPKEIRFKLPEATKKKQLISYDKAIVPWKKYPSEGTTPSDLPGLVKRPSKSPSGETPASTEERPGSRGAERVDACAPDEGIGASSTTTPRWKQQIDPKGPVVTADKEEESKTGESPRKEGSMNFTRKQCADLKILTPGQRESDSSGLGDSAGVSRGDESTSNDLDACAALTDCDEEVLPKDETGDKDTWKDYVSQRKVVDATNYQTFARTRSKTVPTPLPIAQIPNKEAVRDLMSPPMGEQIKVRTLGTRTNKINLQNRPVHARYYYNNLMNQDKILKKRTSQENRFSVSSSRDSVAESPEGGQLRPPVADPQQDNANKSSHIGLPSISPVAVKKRT